MVTVIPEWKLLEEEDEFMPTLEHSHITLKIGRYLGNYVEEHNLGGVYESSAEYRF